jgi:hypothetical protein
MIGQHESAEKPPELSHCPASAISSRELKSGLKKDGQMKRAQGLSERRTCWIGRDNGRTPHFGDGCGNSLTPEGGPCYDRCSFCCGRARTTWPGLPIVPDFERRLFLKRRDVLTRLFNLMPKVFIHQLPDRYFGLNCLMVGRNHNKPM